MGKKEFEKSRLDFLSHKFINKPIKGSNEVITKSDFDVLVKTDPSDRKKYLLWLLTLLNKGSFKLEDSGKANEYLTYLMNYKKKLPESKEIEYQELDHSNGSYKKRKKVINPRNIADYPTLESLFFEVQFLMDMDEEDLVSETEKIKTKKEEGIELVFEDERWKVVIPLTQDMANLYGKGSQWCTTSSKSMSGYGLDYYVNRQYPGSKLYIIIDKKANKNERRYHKHQFHFESKQFMDATNSGVDINTFFDNKEVLLDAFLDRGDSFAFYLKMLFNKGFKDGDKIIKGDVNFSVFNFKNNIFPTGLVIKGDAIFSGSSIEIIGSLKVEGDLILVNSKVKAITGYLDVKGSVYAKESKIKKLPDGTRIGVTGSFFGSNLSDIPFDMYVGQDLDLSLTNVAYIVKDLNLEVNGDLFVHALGMKTEEIEVKNVNKIHNLQLNID